MAVIRVPFCAIAELCPSFILSETFSDPNGVKSILFDTKRLHVAARQQTIEVPEVGTVEMCLYYVSGSIPYICAAYPVVGTARDPHVQQHMATFSTEAGNTAKDAAITMPADALGWISAAGCAQVDARIGGNYTAGEMPDIEGVTVEELAVSGNSASELFPKPETEEEKQVVKWHGCFVITTTD
jgi:hypothetical protein